MMVLIESVVQYRQLHPTGIPEVHIGNFDQHEYRY